MKKYVFVDEFNRVVGNPESRDIQDVSKIATNPNGQPVLKEYIDVIPPYNPLAQRVAPIGLTVSNTTVTMNYAVSEISPEEIALTGFKNIIAQGFDTQRGFIISLEEKDRNMLLGAYVLLGGIIEANPAAVNSPFAITGADGIDYEITMAEARQIILEYGIYFNQVRSQYRTVINT
jgi:hypothetical protein